MLNKVLAKNGLNKLQTNRLNPLKLFLYESINQTSIKLCVFLNKHFKIYTGSLLIDNKSLTSSLKKN